MRKILLLSILFIAMSFAGNTYAITSHKVFGAGVSVGADSVQYNLETWWKSNVHYSVMLVDTFTLFSHVAAAESTLDLGDYYSNVLVSSLNGAGESAYALVAPLYTTHIKGHWHNDTIARNFSALRAGCNSSDTSVYIPMRIRYLWLRKVAAGDADSVVVIRIQAWR